MESNRDALETARRSVSSPKRHICRKLVSRWTTYLASQLVGILALSLVVGVGWSNATHSLVIWMVYLPYVVAGLFYVTEWKRLRHLSALAIVLFIGGLIFPFPPYGNRLDGSGFAIFAFSSPVFFAPIYIISFLLARFGFPAGGPGKHSDRLGRRH